MLTIAITLMFAASNDVSDLIYLRIKEDYFDEKSGLYREYWVPRPEERKGENQQPAFNWGVGVMISALNGLAKKDRRYIPELEAYLEKASTYWNPQGPVAGFDVLPGPSHPIDRYYDDNAWMVLALVEAYEITRNKLWLNQATRALDFVLSGRDEKLGGGIYWREKEKLSKNTCSCGPSAAACIAVYRHTKNKELLKEAENLYLWTQKTLQDPEDYLYWDNISLAGKVDKFKWSYNSGLMLRTAKELYQITKNPAYGLDAHVLEKACIAKWLKSDGVIDDELQFAHLLFENLDHKRFDYQKSVTSLVCHLSKEGRASKRWGIMPRDRDRLQLIHQASVLRVLTISSQWRRMK
jgi:rhamnogalacturonyl hydrolase YesR